MFVTAILAKLSMGQFRLQLLFVLASWSSGMIPASGAGGPGFDPRRSPFSVNDLRENFMKILPTI
jgi:hypothetical protein